MEKQPLHIVKIGGNVLRDEITLHQTLEDLAKIQQPLLIVHGGGKHVNEWLERIGAEIKMVEGRRITDALSLDLAVMNYAGLINKQIVAFLSSKKVSAVGLSGADLQSITASKRQHPTIDFGFVGDITEVNVSVFKMFIEQKIVPVCCAITCDTGGQLLNTNADTIAAEIAIAMSTTYTVHLWYCFEKKGVLADEKDDNSVVGTLSHNLYDKMLQSGQIHTGMKPKLQNCFRAVKSGVQAVHITDSEGVKHIPAPSGTLIKI